VTDDDSTNYGRARLQLDPSQSTVGIAFPTVEDDTCTLFEKTPIIQAFADEKTPNADGPSHNQLCLFDI